jgi:hypothetical protein
MNDPSKRCENCLYFEPVGTQGEGWCAEEPRRREEICGTKHRYPVAHGYEWCGHFIRKVVNFDDPETPE